MREGDIQRDIQMRATQLGARLFRNQVGKYRLALPDCPRCQAEGRFLTSGLCVGSSDLIGWVPRVITGAAIGTTLAQFAAVEVKSARGRPTKEQTAFIGAVGLAGGVAGIARSATDLDEIL